MKVSTGLRSQMLDTAPLKTIMALGFLKLYGGAIPSDADAAATGTLITTISVNSTGTGISFDAAASGGVLAKAAEVWSGVNGSSTAVTYFRHVAVGDDGTLSTTQPRIQGTVGTAGADLNISSTSLVSGATQTIDFYNVALPTL